MERKREKNIKKSIRHLSLARGVTDPLSPGIIGRRYLNCNACLSFTTFSTVQPFRPLICMLLAMNNRTREREGERRGEGKKQDVTSNRVERKGGEKSGKGGRMTGVD